MKLHVLSIASLALLGAPSALAQDGVEVTVEGTVISPVAFAEMSILTEGNFGSVARSPTAECRYFLRDNDALSFVGPQGDASSAPGFNGYGCGALNDNVQTPTISYTCPVGTYVQIRTRRDTFNANDYAEFQAIYGTGDNFAALSSTRTNLGGGNYEFNTYCRPGGDGEAIRTITVYGQVLLQLEAGTPESDESFSLTLPLEIQY